MTMYSICLCVSVLLACWGCTSIHASPVGKQFLVHRLIHYSRDGKQFGSLRSKLSAVPVRVDPLRLLANNPDYRTFSKRVFVLNFTATSVDWLQKVLANVRVAGFLFVLPQEPPVPLSSDDENTRKLESFLINQSIHVPVYFVEYTPEMVEFADSLSKVPSENAEPMQFKYLFSSELKLQSNAKEAREVSSVQGVSFQGWLYAGGSEEESKRSSKGTLVVAATYDSFSLVPGLARSASLSSGPLALLELARVMKNKLSRKFNIRFLLTTGASNDFKGTEKFLVSLEERAAKLGDFVLCIDSVVDTSHASAQTLHLHLSRLPKDTPAKHITDALNSSASAVGIKLETHIQKMMKFYPGVYWAHEPFVRIKLDAATLSHLPSPSPNMRRSSLFDADFGEAPLKTIRRTVKWLSDALERTENESEHKPAAKEEDEDNGEALLRWQQLFRNHSRVFPLMPHDSPFVAQLYAEMKSILFDVTKQQNLLSTKPEMIFFKDQLTTTLSAYENKGLEFDIGLSLVAALYLFVLYALVRRGELGDWNIFGSSNPAHARSYSSSSRNKKGH